jgi:glycerol-3-phosphate dehydrogenase (NAD(P)+)
MSAPSVVAVLGGGAWGTALALTALRAGHAASLWARDGETVDAINEKRENPRYLPGIRLDAELRATADLAQALRGADCILVATPAQTLRGLLTELRGRFVPEATLVLCAKGIERESGRLMSDIAAEIMPRNPVAALSGPSFAADVARGLPTAVTVAAREEERAVELAEFLSAPHFRCYSSSDLIGVEIGGALKNVMAIAAGATAGAGLGASAQAAIVTRGFVELRRIGGALGARPETLFGLSGLGDLILTCSSPQSRNFAYGMALGRGESVEGRPLAEGVATAGIAATIATEHGIDAPITQAVNAILGGRMSIREAVAALMSRPLKSESE